MLKYIFLTICAINSIGCAVDDCNKNNLVADTITDTIIMDKQKDDDANRGVSKWYWCEVTTSYYGVKTNAVPIINLASAGYGSVGVGEWVKVTAMEAALEDVVNPNSVNPWRDAGENKFADSISNAKSFIIGTPICYRVSEVIKHEDLWRRCEMPAMYSPVTPDDTLDPPVVSVGSGPSGGDM